VFAETAMNWRVTMTLPVLDNASRIMFLVSGRSKAGIVRKLFDKEKRHAYPAGRIALSHGSIVWLLDKDASSAMETDS
jgi:6-phosphogluconolactonase